MKKIFLLITVVVAMVACKTNDKKTAGKEGSEYNPERSLADSANYTTIQWLDSTFHDMGKVQKGDVVEVSFRFKNTGNKPLVIADVSAGCGCTVPEKPTQPYAPGKEGFIKAKFDSKNQAPGEHRKNVTVTANTTPATVHSLSFRVEIEEKDKSGLKK